MGQQLGLPPVGLQRGVARPLWGLWRDRMDAAGLRGTVRLVAWELFGASSWGFVKRGGSIGELSSRTGCSAATVKRALAALREAGVIGARRRRRASAVMWLTGVDWHAVSTSGGDSRSRGERGPVSEMRGAGDGPRAAHGFAAVAAAR